MIGHDNPGEFMLMEVRPC